MTLFCASIRNDSIPFMRFAFFSHVLVFSRSLFFPVFVILFFYRLRLCRQRCYWLYNNYYFVLFNAVLASFYWCNPTNLNVGLSYFSFSWHLFSKSSHGYMTLCIVLNFHVFCSICPSSWLSILRIIRGILQEGGCPVVYFFDEISAAELGFNKFPCSSKALLYLLSSPFDGVRFKNSHGSFCLVTFHYQYGTFFMPNPISISRLNIIIVWIMVSFFFSNNIVIIHVHNVVVSWYISCRLSILR